MMDFSVFEALMLICFGLSWPFSIARAIRDKSSKGKSLLFLILLELAYICGILHKVLVDTDIVLALYVLNLAMVSIDIVLYLRNTQYDKQRKAETE